LARITERRDEVLDVFAAAYGRDEARKHFNYWRIFFMACAELFGYRDGTEWFVVHSLLRPCVPSGSSGDVAAASHTRTRARQGG
jgi:cyclopropane-fatty-acyl-phospholipid synthase